MATAIAPAASAARSEHPLLLLTTRRLGVGVLTLFVVSAIVFLATEVAPAVLIALLTVGTNTFTDAVARVTIGVDRRRAEGALLDDLSPERAGPGVPGPSAQGAAAPEPTIPKR